MFLTDGNIICVTPLHRRISFMAVGERPLRFFQFSLIDYFNISYTHKVSKVYDLVLNEIQCIQ